MTITERIFVVLAQKKLSQKEFAKRIEVNEKTVSAWKKNNSLPPVDKISKISDCLEVTIDYLLTGKECYADEQKNGNNIHTGNVTNSKIVGGHDHSLTLSASISDDALEIDKIIKSFDPKKRAKFLYQVYDLAEKLKDN